MISFKRSIAFLCIFIFITMLIHLGLQGPSTFKLPYLKQDSDNINGNNSEQVHRRKSDSIKTIQWFDTFHNSNGLRSRSDVVDFRKCKYRNCKLLDYFEAADNDSMNGPLDADAVIMQGSHLGEMTPLLRRDNDQVFVFAERETWWHRGLYHSMMSPEKPYKTVKESELDWYSKTVPSFLSSPQYYMNTLGFRDAFNWTMTYRQDSDIPMLYGQVLHKKDASNSQRAMLERENQKRRYERIFRDKKLNVVWLVSHCATKSKREKYVEKLRQYINVDIFGKCGQDLCPKKPGQSGCLDSIIKTYKFVLSFENTFHKDYVTEKLFDWFSRNIVPVVYGMADYKNIVPDSTIINAADFSSPKLLANYLHYVGSNRDIYLKYLRQKRRYFTVGHDVMQQNAYCQLCDWLHNLDSHRQSYPKIDKWWQLNDTSGYLKLYKQAVPSSGNNHIKHWTGLSFTAVTIFVLLYGITYVFRRFDRREIIERFRKKRTLDIFNFNRSTQHL